MAEDQQFYIGQKVVLEKDGKVLVLFDEIFGADLPGGKIQVDETDFKESLKREVFEETGLKIEIGKPIYTGYFMKPRSAKGINHRNAGKNTYLVYFTAKYISGELRLSSEHERYQWIDKNTFRDIKEINIGNTIKALEAYFFLKSIG